MNIPLARAYYPKVTHSHTTLILAYLLASLVIVMLTAQLMTFEKFIPVMENYRLPGGDQAAHLFVVLLVIAQWLSLPFLLRMSLSPLFRALSLGMLVYVMCAWIFLSYWVLTTQPPLTGSGIFGSLFSRLLKGNELVFFASMFTVLVITVIYRLRKDISTVR